MDDDKLFDDEEERPKIKVTDRRKFTAEGDLREAEAPAAEAPSAAVADEQPAADQEPAAAPQATADREPVAAEEPVADREPAAEEPVADRKPPAEEEPAAAAGARGRAPSIADLPRDFTAFLEGMYLEAMLYLGAVPDPRTGEPAEDLDMAKYKIDLLGMIQEKTRGNLTDEEAQQLEEVLYQLRMFFVQRGKGGAG